MHFRTLVFGTAALLTTAIAQVQAQPTVTQAELFAGNPSYDEPQDRATDGQGLLADPPLRWRNLLFVGDNLVTSVGQEIWFTDTKAANPVTKRLAGKENPTGQSLKPGPGRDARFANIFGMDALSDGSLVGADQTGNDIFKVTDPFGPNCTVELLAGTTKAMDSVSPGSPPNVGDVDGPGAGARFALPQWPAVIDDNIYFIDEGNHKIKKVANDAAHTVSTVAKIADDVYYAMIALNGKLYALGNNTTSEGFILEIDPASGTVRDIVRGHSDTFESNGAINVSGLATDGKGLFTTQTGQLLYVTLDGQVKSIAGTGDMMEFRGAYDPKKSQTAEKVQLIANRRLATAGSNVFLAYHDNAVYHSAVVDSPYIERLSLK